ncbi:MAG: hypothetical protein A2297_07850 [Elusimicrobia bacterium RIFOXYB2_FULL_48_7]|nr:MAG: hypothetical protein A2297_07850 [Elusimicrobia bacterium RIFOXYB2_FULL_48_7]
MLALIVGLLVVCVSAWIGLNFCLVDIIIVLKGSLPIMFFFGGLLAVIAGITALKDENDASKKGEEEPKKD